jgi:DNA-damage-inducible protein J
VQYFVDLQHTQSTKYCTSYQRCPTIKILIADVRANKYSYDVATEYSSMKRFVMAQTPTTTMRIDPELKKDANEVFATLGLDLTSAVRIFLKAVVREKQFPFNPGA